jgi:hypothetical protein
MWKKQAQAHIKYLTIAYARPKIVWIIYKFPANDSSMIDLSIDNNGKLVHNDVARTSQLTVYVVHFTGALPCDDRNLLLVEIKGEIRV